MESPGENPTSFIEFIELDKPMTPQEAISQLATFHNAQPEDVVAAFRNLRDCTDGTVIFKAGINNSSQCIIMEGIKPDGTTWSHLINSVSGQPQARCG